MGNYGIYPSTGNSYNNFGSFSPTYPTNTSYMMPTSSQPNYNFAGISPFTNMTSPTVGQSQIAFGASPYQPTNYYGLGTMGGTSYSFPGYSQMGMPNPATSYSGSLPSSSLFANTGYTYPSMNYGTMPTSSPYTSSSSPYAYSDPSFSGYSSPDPIAAYSQQYPGYGQPASMPTSYSSVAMNPSSSQNNFYTNPSNQGQDLLAVFQQGSGSNGALGDVLGQMDRFLA